MADSRTRSALDALYMKNIPPKVLTRMIFMIKSELCTTNTKEAVWNFNLQMNEILKLFP